MASKLTIKTYVNNDEAAIVINSPGHIKDCWGFAIYRRFRGETITEAEPLPNLVGFSGDAHFDDEMRPSTEWPFQKYIWVDYYVRSKDVVSYKAIPMIAMDGKLQKSTRLASGWSPFKTIGNPPGAEAYFNRGLVSSQFVNRRLASIPEAEKSKTLMANLKNPSSKLRNFMGGNLLFALYRLINEVKFDKSLQLYAALYELDEPEIIKGMNAVGKRAHIILANGAFSQAKKDPQHESAILLSKTDLTRRIVSSPHFAHNKFIVITRKLANGKEKPVKVWTGSTNLTLNGLFTQVNNAVILRDASVAAYYKTEWDAIKADCDEQGKGLYAAPFKNYNSNPSVNSKKTITTYFTPVSKAIDLDAADELIKAAKKGVLFLMFKPGVAGSSRLLYDTILDLAKAKPGLLVNGVMNSDPGGNKNPTITFLHKNTAQRGDMAVVLPGSISEKFQFWTKEIGRKNVTIHSKVIVIDPFGKDPVIITGSHNMGGKASKSNDDNLNIISGNPKLAQAYAIHMMGVYHHYRWRFYRSKKSAEPLWDGNIKSDAWQKWFLSGDKKKELLFWTAA